MLVLQLSPVLERAVVVAKMQLARRTHSGNYTTAGRSAGHYAARSGRQVLVVRPLRATACIFK
jgi:hypothetical protein